MRNKVLSVFFIIFFSVVTQCSAYWIWTPETRKWTNPKHATKDSPSQQLAYAKEIFDSGAYEKALKEFEKLVHRFPKAFEAAEGQYFEGRCLEEMRMPYKAHLAYQKVVNKYPFSERNSEIVERQFKLAERILEGEKRAFWDVISARDYPVVEILRAVINNEPYGPFAGAAYYKLGMYYKNLSFYEDAKKEFSKVITDHPDSEWVKPARYQIAFCDALMSSKAGYDQDNSRAAQEGFEEFLKDYPDAELSEKARAELKSLREEEAESQFKVAQFYHRKRAYKSAKIYYQYVVDRFNDTSWASPALEKIQEIGQKE
ncbi:outer membrane protein assembly factor BamD [Candidatus Omnitrophota bacterium]